METVRPDLPEELVALGTLYQAKLRPATGMEVSTVLPWALIPERIDVECLRILYLLSLPGPKRIYAKIFCRIG